MIVADVNVLAYLFIAGIHTPAAEAVQRKDPDWVAPWLWRSELLSVLMKNIRARLMTRDKASEVFNLASRTMLYPSLEPLPAEILRLAESSGCTAYDCEYVALAEALGVPLVTAEQKVLATFPLIAVSMEDFVK